MYRDLQDAPRAIAALQRAADQKSKNDTLNGRIYGQLASLFAYQGAYEESKEATREACIYNIRCKNYKGLAYSYRNMARMFDKEAEKDSAEFYYRKAYRVMKEKAEPRWAYGILSELSSFYSKLGKAGLGSGIGKGGVEPVCLSCGAIGLGGNVLPAAGFRFGSGVLPEGVSYGGFVSPV